MRKTQMINRDQIAERAFEIWEREGQPHGRDQEHWQRAEAELAETMKKMTTPPSKRATAKAPAKPAAKPAAAKATAKTAAKPATKTAAKSATKAPAKSARGKAKAD